MLSFLVVIQGPISLTGQPGNCLCHRYRSLEHIGGFTLLGALTGSLDCSKLNSFLQAAPPSEDVMAYISDPFLTPLSIY